MFDALKNLGNIGGLMAKATEMRERMTRMQEEMARKTVTGDAGAGMVTATVNGRLELIKLKIEQVVVAGFEPGAPVRRDEGGRHGHLRERESRSRHGPKSPVQMPAPAAHLPTVAADGFDFSKPYAPSADTPNGAAKPPAPRRALRPVAALLGGAKK